MFSGSFAVVAVFVVLFFDSKESDPRTGAVRVGLKVLLMSHVGER